LKQEFRSCSTNRRRLSMALRCVRVARFTLLLISFAVLVAIVALSIAS